MPVLMPPFLPAGGLCAHAQPTLRTDELTLRPWHPSDVEPLHEAYRDAEIQRWHVRSLTLDEAQEWIAQRSSRWQQELGADWAVTDRTGLVGRVGLRAVYLGEGYAEVAYWVVPPARGRAIAARALGSMGDWLFSVVGLHRLELRHSTRNTGSCRVAVKAGFVHEGTLGRQLLHADGWHDMHVHARVADDLATLGFALVKTGHRDSAG